MNPYDIYTSTLPIIGTENLIMGLTLLFVFSKKRTKASRYRQGIYLMATAMLTMAAINYLEMASKVISYAPSDPLAVAITAASIQMFLLLYAFLSLMDSTFLLKRRIVMELVLIALFTMPPLFVSADTQPDLFNVLFYISIAFYLIKYVANFMVYSKYYHRTQIKLRNFYSDGDAQILDWVHYTFYTVLAIGALSVVVPLTNYAVLVVYQALLFFGYLYIYWEVIRHEVIFCNIQLIHLEAEEQRLPETEQVAQESEKNMSEEHLSAQKESILNRWILEQHYAKPGITIDDVAAQLKTSRTVLSLYLNTELKLNFYEWISEVRMKEAQKILASTPGLPITEVAIHVGIIDRSNFDKLFKRIVGISPAAYRIQQATQQIRESKQMEQRKQD